MKITKTIAEEVSIKMSEKIYGEKIKKKEDLLLSLANQEVLNSIPSDLMDVFNKYRPYLKTSYCVVFKADTLDNLRINVDCFPSKSDWYPCIEITRKSYENMLSIR